jgi:hypothetical protein
MDRGYTGKMLSVDLNTGQITVETPADALYRQYIGGYGIGARMLWDRVPAGADPLGPENMLGMFPGLLQLRRRLRRFAQARRLGRHHVLRQVGQAGVPDH